MHSTQLLTPAETAERLGTTTGTLAYWRSRKQGPPYVKLGPQAVRYRESDLAKFIESRTHRPVSA